jgi:hypothetical protein
LTRRAIVERLQKASVDQLSTAGGQADVGEAVLPEHRKGFFKHSFTAEFSRAGHILGFL